LAVTYFVLAFRNKLSRRAQLAAVILCGLHPYFMSFHSSALTESVPASIILISLGLAIRALDDRLSLRVSLSLLLLFPFLPRSFDLILDWSALSLLRWSCFSGAGPGAFRSTP
jgi:hypothetical protein